VSYYPVYLNLQNKPVLLVGAGEIALQKIPALLEAGARLHVVAPVALPEIAALGAERKLEWSPRPYQPADMEGVRLVIAATDDIALQPRIAEEARRRGIWVNVVDVPPLCDFIAPAIVRKGDLQLAISTGGAAPALSKYLRKRFEPLLGPEYDHFMTLAKRFRPELMKLPKKRRMGIWACLASDWFLEKIQREGLSSGERLIKEWIDAKHAS